MNRQPLHIHTKKRMRILLEDPALCVKAEGDADRLYPLRFIERIQVSGPVAWETTALLACVDRGISIQFVDPQGETRARMVGSGRLNHSLVDNLQRLFNNPNWEPGYRQWCRGRGLQTQRYVAQKLGYRYREARDLVGLPNWCEQRLAMRVHLVSARRCLQWLHVDLYGLVTQYLQSKGLWNVSQLTLEEPVDLARDMTNVLQWVLLIVRDRELRHHDYTQPIDHRLVAAWFAANSGYFNYQIARIVNLLEIWIMETA